MTNYQHIKIIRKPIVLDRTGYSRSTLHIKIKNGLHPPPISLGERSVGWIESEVEATLRALVAGKTNTEIKTLVNSLLAERQKHEEQM